MRAPLLVLVLAACSGDTHLAVGKDCNPLGFGGHCAVPWPSSVFEVADASMATGRRLAIPSGALPANFQGTPIDPTMWNIADGFSPSAPMLVAFPEGVSADGLTTPDDLAPSLAADSPTVLVDMTT